MKRLLANSEFLGQAEFVDLSERRQEFFLVVVIVRKLDDILFLCAHQLGWQDQEIGADGVERGEAPIVGQTQSLEPMDDVGGEENHLKERYVGRPVSRWDFGKRVIVDQLPDMFFDVGSNRIETINPPRIGFEVGDEDVIKVLLVLEQSQLLGFFWVLGDRAPHYYKTVLPCRIVSDFLPELSSLPAIGQFLKLAASGPVFDIGVFLRYDDVFAVLAVEKFHGPLAIKPRVHPEADARSRNVCGCFGQTYFEKRNDPSAGGRVAWPQRTMPEFLERGLETQQRMIRTSAVLFGIVSHPSAFVFAVDDKDCRVDVENQTVAHSGQGKHISPQTVVKSDQLADGFGWKSFEESPQTGLIGKVFESQHFQESSVVLQDVGLVDPTQSHDDGEHQRQDQFG